MCGLLILTSAIVVSARPARADEDETLRVLGPASAKLATDYMLQQIKLQYDQRRQNVERAYASRESLKEHQHDLRRRLQQLIGTLPERTPLVPRITGTIETDDYRIDNLIFASQRGVLVSANLYVPHGKGPFPGVLVPCGHSGLGKAYAAYQSVAILLARHGFLTLVYDPLCQGERRQSHTPVRHMGTRHKLLNVNSLLVGRTFVTYSLWDGIRAIDYLHSHPLCDRSKPVGVTGNSGGGAQTMYLMAFDDRVGPAAPSCHITTLERNFILGGAGDGCQSPPYTGSLGFDHPDFFVIRAPRPSIILAAEKDYKDIVFTRKTHAEARGAYELLGAGDRIDMFAFDDQHAFSLPRRQAAVRWMRRWLKGEDAAVVETEAKLHTAAELRVTRTGHVIDEDHARSIPELNLAHARALAAARKQFRDNCTSWPKSVSKLLGLEAPGPTPRIVRKQVVMREGVRIHKWELHADGEPVIPALHFQKANNAEPQAWTLIVDGRGKHVEARSDGEILALVAAGRTVLSIDARGFGETADPAGAAPYATGDHRLAMWALHLGRPLLSQRVTDVLNAVDAINQSGNVSDLELIGIGKGGPVALHAAIVDQRIDRVRVRDSISSWIDDVVRQPAATNVIGHVIPGILKSYDLPDLVEVLGDRHVEDQWLAAKQPNTIRIAGIVAKWVRGDKQANYARVEPMIREAAKNGADIVCTTECFLDGYAIADKSIPLEKYRSLGEPIPSGTYCKKLKSLAQELKVQIVAGMLEADGGFRYNTAIMISPEGKLVGKYRKQHLGHESVRNTPGDHSTVFSTAHGNLGVMICADRRFPAIVNRFVDNGADWLICPSGGMFGPDRNDPIVQARSRETGKYIVFVHPAEFLVTAPNGSIASRTILGDRLLVTKSERDTAVDSRRVFYFDLPSKVVGSKPTAR